MTKKTKLPFSMMPASWGLKGKSRAIAEAEYYYEGEELEKVLAELNAESDDEKVLSALDIDLKNGRIGREQYDKRKAEILEEPYVNVIHMDVNPENAKAGYIELDWNDHFVKFLHENGYTGTSDEDVVNKWFNDVCRTVLIQEQADLDYGLQEERDDVIKRDGTESKD
jgi:hypothetical protein|tara:strand:+ start:2051 stop:2554 length:504 start_codon:yes stop_codon:yes gene_type:complete